MMAKTATGELRKLATGWEARVTVAGRRRRGFFLATCVDEASARERCTAMAAIAARLRRAGLAADVEKLMKLAASQRAGKPWLAVLQAVDIMCAGTTSSKSEIEQTTFGAFAGEWTSGKLHERFPDHVPKKNAEQDERTLRLYVFPELEDTPLRDVGLDDVERVMAALPERLGTASRRHVAQVTRRVLALAVYPGRLIAASPIPRGWLPKLRGTKAFTYIYPDEDRALLGCQKVTVLRRLLFGILAREGLRRDELVSLRFRDLDLAHGLVRLDENKTDDPRSWALDPGVAEALRLWKKHHRAGALEDDLVFVNEDGVALNVNHLADELRAALKTAGIKRPTLFETNDARRRLRVHDLRATFVTVSLANGRSETWVADRTGHRSSEMINRYRRAARTWSETALGTFAPLAEALPDLRPLPQGLPHVGTSVHAQKRRNVSGEKGIRTLGTLASSHDFQSGRISQSSREMEKSRETDSPREHEKDRATVTMGQRWGNETPPDDVSPRSVALGDLYRNAERLASLGDLAGARELHATIGRLLEASAPHDGASVVDLRAERAKRDRKP